MHLLDALRSKGNTFHSGEELARAAGISRSAIWKRIEELRERGYEIEARPRQGYRLTAAPDRPYPEEVADQLRTATFGRQVVYLEETTSTNDVARRLGSEGWPEGTVVVAEKQLAGRGRLGRTWLSMPGGLMFSLVLRPDLEMARLGPLTIVAAVAIRRVILDSTGIAAAIKWPNDLQVEGRKIAGILAEAVGEIGRADLVVLGIGLNVNQEGRDFPPPLSAAATSLRMLLGGTVRRVPILRAFLETFEDLYKTGKADGYRTALAEAARYSATLGKMVRLTQGGGELVVGKAVRLDFDGALILETVGGPRRILAGDVEEIRNHA